MCTISSFFTENINSLFLGWFLGLLSPMLFLILNNWIANRNKKQEIRRILRNDIFLICDKLIRYAVHCNQRALTAKYYYAMHKVQNDEEFDKALYLKYVNDSETSQLSFTLLKADLLCKVGELKIYWTKRKDTFEIEKLLKEENYDIIKKFDGVFTEEMTINEIEKVYKKELGRVEEYVTSHSNGKNLTWIRNYMHPIYQKK